MDLIKAERMVFAMAALTADSMDAEKAVEMVGESELSKGDATVGGSVVATADVWVALLVAWMGSAMAVKTGIAKAACSENLEAVY